MGLSSRCASYEHWQCVLHSLDAAVVPMLYYQPVGFLLDRHKVAVAYFAILSVCRFDEQGCWDDTPAHDVVPGRDPGCWVHLSTILKEMFEALDMSCGNDESHAFLPVCLG